MFKRKIRFFIIGMLLVSGMTGCNNYQKGNLNSGSEAVSTEENSEKMEENKEMIEKNTEILMKKLDIGETGARGCAQKLQRGNFGIIESIEDLEDDGSSLGMYLIDESGKRFYITMDDKGYVGYIQNEAGEYVYAPVD